MGIIASIIWSGGKSSKTRFVNASTFSSWAGVASGTFDLKPASAPVFMPVFIPSIICSTRARICIKSKNRKTSALPGASGGSAACCATLGVPKTNSRNRQMPTFLILLSSINLIVIFAADQINAIYFKIISPDVVTPLTLIVERFKAQDPPRPAQFLLNPQQLVVLGDAVRARCRSGLDLSRPGRDGEVGDDRVFAFARSMRDHRRVAVPQRQIDGVESLTYRSDLINFDQDRVGHTFIDALLQTIDVSDEQIVDDQLNLVANFFGEQCPTFPVVFGKAIFD